VQSKVILARAHGCAGSMPLLMLMARPDSRSRASRHSWLKGRHAWLERLGMRLALCQATRPKRPCCRPGVSATRTAKGFEIRLLGMQGMQGGLPGSLR